jgi:hypothetical protein
MEVGANEPGANLEQGAIEQPAILAEDNPSYAAF